jgi:rSAM/selenodomain-associated transferase 1
MRNNDIVFGLMCKAPVAGACKTRLCPPLAMPEAAQLSRCFIADMTATVAEVRKEGGVTAAVIYTPAGGEAAFDGLLPRRFAMLSQRGRDVGERLQHAIDDLLAAGYAGVCLMNSDSPTLPAAILAAAGAALSRPGDRIVLGPAIDGGYYLVGVKRRHPELFRDIAWSSSQVLAQTLTRAADPRVPVSLLPLWYDVDDLSSLQLLLHELFGAGNPLLADGETGSPAACTRGYLQQLLRAVDAGRFGWHGAGPPGRQHRR